MRFVDLRLCFGVFWKTFWCPKSKFIEETRPGAAWEPRGVLSVSMKFEHEHSRFSEFQECLRRGVLRKVSLWIWRFSFLREEWKRWAQVRGMGERRTPLIWFVRVFCRRRGGSRGSAARQPSQTHRMSTFETHSVLNDSKDWDFEYEMNIYSS